MIHSDWHVHSEYSYDASTPIETIAQNAQKQGLRFVGITEHLNFNTPQFLNDVKSSVAAVKELQKKYPFLVPGVELTPIEKPEFDYIAKHGTREGYESPVQDDLIEIAMAAGKEELKAFGVRYAVGGSHWRVDMAKCKRKRPIDRDENMREWYRQQMYLACDERVTVLAHPWDSPRGLWFDDFSVIPRSMNQDLAAALKENGKYVECNACFFKSDRTSEKFRHQYAEFMRELFETGIPVTYGSDAHSRYDDLRPVTEKYLAAAGFKDGDVCEIAEKDLW